jgi:Stress responsive A/B Barrel Domain
MNQIFRRILPGCAIVAVFAAGVMVGQNQFGQPKTVLHMVALKWKPESSAADRQKAIDGVKTMAGKVPGVKNVWVKTLKVQGTSQDNPYDATFAIEFADEAAHKAYATHPAHDEWGKIYNAIRADSRNHVATN